MKTILYGIGIFVGFCFLMSWFERPAVTAPDDRHLMTARQNAMRENLKFDFKWHVTAYDLQSPRFMKADFTITNGNDFDIKDIRITCEHIAPSGTTIDNSTRTIYDII